MSGSRKGLRGFSTRAGKFCAASLSASSLGVLHSPWGLTDPLNSMISYPNYKFTFTMKALGMFAVRTGNEPLA